MERRIILARRYEGMYLGTSRRSLLGGVGPSIALPPFPHITNADSDPGSTLQTSSPFPLSSSCCPFATVNLSTARRRSSCSSSGPLDSRATTSLERLSLVVRVSCLASLSLPARRMRADLSLSRSDIVSAIGSFVVGFLGNIYGKFTRGSPFVVMVAGYVLVSPSPPRARLTSVLALRSQQSSPSASFRPRQRRFAPVRRRQLGLEHVDQLVLGRLLHRRESGGGRHWSHRRSLRFCCW